MGVPSFFRWLAAKFPACVRMAAGARSSGDPGDPSAPGPNGAFDNLYLDLNGIIHPCCHPEGADSPATEELVRLPSPPLGL
jgi:5'-3' exoribonuclease 2